MLYGRRRFARDEFVLHGGGENHFSKQGRKKIDLSDQDEIV